jgi:hypothetical protein
MFPLIPIETGISTNSPWTSWIRWSIPARVNPAIREVRAAIETAVKACRIVRRSEAQ